MFKTFMDWTHLDLKNEYSRPRNRQMVVMYFKDKRYSMNHYEVGYFDVPEGKRKPRWYKNGGTWGEDLTRRLKDYECKWCYIPPLKADGTW